jgi:predicted metal-dependent hydrolase
MISATQELTIKLDGQSIAYRLTTSRVAHKLRVRVGPQGVEVIQPKNRARAEVESFITARSPWILSQLKRAVGFRQLRRTDQHAAGRILFRGVPVKISTAKGSALSRSNIVTMDDNSIVVHLGKRSVTPASRSLETWLRKQARHAIEAHLAELISRLGQRPSRVYLMGQRTKWGNCSRRRNLSFNWRLIMAPPAVLRYLVTHEAVHLAIPDHSSKFWLTVQSLCPELERAKQWLRENKGRMMVDLGEVVGP